LLCGISVFKSAAMGLAGVLKSLKTKKSVLITPLSFARAYGVGGR